MIGSLFHHLWVESEWMDIICNLNESSIDMSENKNVVRLSVKNFVHCNNKYLGKVPRDEWRCRSDSGAGEGSTIDGRSISFYWMMAARDLTETIDRCMRSDGDWTADTRDEWRCRSDRSAWEGSMIGGHSNGFCWTTVASEWLPRTTGIDGMRGRAAL